MIKRPYLLAIDEYAYLVPTGKNAESIFEPSRGGIGIRLKIAKLILSKTTKLKIITKFSYKPKYTSDLTIIPNTKAIKKFDKGPANATKGSAIFLFLRL